MPFGKFTLNDGNKVRGHFLKLHRAYVGWQIPAIAYGSGTVWKFTEVAPYVEQALEVGFESLDTAACMNLILSMALPLINTTCTGYQTEEGVGQGIKESGLDREALFITTKFGGRGTDVDKEIQISLRNVRFS